MTKLSTSFEALEEGVSTEVSRYQNLPISLYTNFVEDVLGHKAVYASVEDISDLITKGSHTPEIHENVSILFCDFVGFTSITTTMTPVELIEELSSIFSEFDEICSRNDATRIKTIGDAYMAVCGLNGKHSDHAARLSRVGLGFIDFLKKRNLQTGPDWICRIGIHSGSVIGGIVVKSCQKCFCRDPTIPPSS
jgi:class 3 adenylate cyclase